MPLAKDCTYILIHQSHWKGEISILGTFQDEDLFVQFLNGMPKENIMDLYISKFINNEVRPAPLIDSISVNEYLNSP